MIVHVVDSDRHCPGCGKRMVINVGQDETRDGEVRLTHECWSCGFYELDTGWAKAPKDRR